MARYHDILVFCLLFILITYFSRRWWSRRSLSRVIPGPKDVSWTYGHLPQLLLTPEYGENEFQWQNKYGPVYSIQGCLGEPRLMISDPTTAKYIINSGVFVFGHSHQKIANVLFGPGNVFLATGDAHRHLRGIMNPWFSAKNVRTFLPIVEETSRKNTETLELVDRWESLNFAGSTVDVFPTLNDATLDINGKAIFGHEFNSLEGQSEVAKIQRRLSDSVSSPSKFAQLMDAALPYIPDVVFRLALNLPMEAARILRDYKRMTDELALDLAFQMRDAQAHEGFLSRFVDASGLPDPGIGVHLRTTLIAGQDTTGATFGWILYKLAQMPDYQRDLRREIQTAGLGEHLDYKNLPLLNAIINEVLRMYCAFPLSERVASEDCILPLSQPITTTTGSQMFDIPFKKGQCLYLAMAGHNRRVLIPSIWGPDAGDFRPSRWLEKEPRKGPALGPHPTGLTFLGGPGVCLGWRFAILTLQVFVVTIVRKYILTLPENDSVRPRLAITLMPTTADGVRQLPLHIEPVT
ncbi:Cytochrome P450 [Mycena venus]|uniref:Cytochrome P450 n=1 Tax=Mycena venus TaxID=2733690 RepID=A0A8H7CVH5_9AGAR|nr:Cytochrome P450 [Mycena venus]